MESVVAVMKDPDDKRTGRRNVRLALVVAALALACYVGVYVVYLTATK